MLSVPVRHMPRDRTCVGVVRSCEVSGMVVDLDLISGVVEK
jgi:hypothetical protein